MSTNVSSVTHYRDVTLFRWHVRWENRLQRVTVSYKVQWGNQFSPLFSPSPLKAYQRKAVFCLRVKFSPPLWVGSRKSPFSPLTNSPLFCQTSSRLINMQQGDFSPLVFLSLSKGYLIKCESAECNKGAAPQSSFISIREASRLSH